MNITHGKDGAGNPAQSRTIPSNGVKIHELPVAIPCVDFGHIFFVV